MCKRYEADEGARKDQIRMHSATIAAPSVVKLPGLVRCRADAALSQRELAARAGISPDTIARLEGGQDARPRTIRNWPKRSRSPRVI